MRRLGFLLILPLAACSTPSAENCKLVQNAELPVTYNAAGLPLIDVQIHGQTLHMLLDTGAMFSILAPQTVNRIGASRGAWGIQEIKGLGGVAESKQIIVPSLQIDRITAKNAKFLTGSKLATSFEGAGQADGLIGQDILHQFNVGLDLPHKRLELFQRSECGGAPPWQGSFDREKMLSPLWWDIEVRIQLNGKKMDALLDSGAAEVTLAQPSLDALGIAPDDRLGSRMLSGLGPNDTKSTVERFDTLTIGAVTYQNPTLFVVPSIPSKTDALLGENYLRWHQVFIDNGTHTIWLGVTQPGS